MKENELTRYLREIGKHSLLTREEEVDVAKQIHDTNLDDRDRRRAREKLIVSNLRLVVSIAKEYARSGVPLHELIAEGNVGLLKAVARFDPMRGFRFSTYATYWIRQSIQLAARQQRRGVKLPAYFTEAVAKARQTYRELSQKLEREPTTGEVEGALPEETRGALRYYMSSEKYGRVVSLDEVFRMHQVQDNSDPAGDGNSSLDVEKLQRVLKVLDDREVQILKLRYGMNDLQSPMTLGEIGEKLGITRERVRQIEERAITKLQREFRKTAS
jgi:RNA polymerase primary sigma factor